MACPLGVKILISESHCIQYHYDILVHVTKRSNSTWLSFLYKKRILKKSHSLLLRSRYGWTHWGRVTHICVINLISIASDNGLSPGWRQAIIWTNAGILLIGHLGTNFSEILMGIHTISLKKMHFKMLSAKWRPFCFGLNVLTFVNYTSGINPIARSDFM